MTRLSVSGFSVGATPLSYVDSRPGDCAAAQPICILYNLDSPSKGVTQVLYDCAALLARRLCEEPSLLGSKAGKAEHGTSKALGMILDLLEWGIQAG